MLFRKETTIPARIPLPSWVNDIVNMPEHKARVLNVIDIKEYLLRKHKVLSRQDFKYKEHTFETAKVMLNTLRTILNTHISYCLGNPVSISGNEKAVSVLNRVYKKGGFNNIDFTVVKGLYTYGNSYEYLYVKDGVISSKIIANEDAYPVYDEDYNYTHFGVVQ